MDDLYTLLLVLESIHFMLIQILLSNSLEVLFSFRTQNFKLCSHCLNLLDGDSLRNSIPVLLSSVTYTYLTFTLYIVPNCEENFCFRLALKNLEEHLNVRKISFVFPVSVSCFFCGELILQLEALSVSIYGGSCWFQMDM